MEPQQKLILAANCASRSYLRQNGKETGQGQMLVRTVDPNKLVDIELKFIKPFENIADTKFLVEPASQETMVSWIISDENISMKDKWMGLTMDKMIGGDFESGLTNLKELSKKK